MYNFNVSSLRDSRRQNGIMSQHDKSTTKYLNLKQELTRALAELEVARLKIEDLKGLLNISSLLNANIDSHRLLETIVAEAKNVIEAEGVALLRFDEKSQTLSYEAVMTDKGMRPDSNVAMKFGEGIAGWVAQHQTPVYAADAAQDDRFINVTELDMGIKVRSVLAVPLISHKKLLGVLKAVNPSLRRFIAKESLELFTFFANQAAAAIDNAKLFSSFKELFVSTVRSLSQALETKDEYTGGHAHRVALFSIILAKEMKLSPKEVENVELSALLHDIGKIGVPEDILTKPAKVTDEEFKEIKKHPVHGFKILEPMEQLDKVLPGIKHHHERWDGKGYPDGLKGEKIPLAARIVCVADAFDAMTSTRPYRKALPDREGLKRLKENAGTQFDPAVVEALIKAYDKGLLITANHEKAA